LAVAQHLPQGSCQAGDRHLNFHETRDNLGIRGVAVHETARIMALGGAGEILVSSTTREVSGGLALSYQDRGVHQLKGIASPRHVFAVVDGG
jgi:class 3 adenylate cyclase